MNLNYKHDTYECSMCLWADQCPDSETCDSFTPLDEELIEIELTDSTRDAYRAAFLQYTDFDSGDFGDWGCSYRKA